MHGRERVAGCGTPKLESCANAGAMISRPPRGVVERPDEKRPHTGSCQPGDAHSGSVPFACHYGGHPRDVQGRSRPPKAQRAKHIRMSSSSSQAECAGSIPVTRSTCENRCRSMGFVHSNPPWTGSLPRKRVATSADAARLAPWITREEAASTFSMRPPNALLGWPHEGRG